MKSIVLYYSYGGSTRKLAQAKAEVLGADLLEAVDIHRPGMLKAFLMGCPAAMRKKSWPIMPLEKNLKGYDKYIVMGPIWAGNFAPQINSIVELLPRGSEVEFIAVSGSGSSGGKEKSLAHAQQHGLKAMEYTDLQASR